MSGDSFSLNPIAAEILELIREQKSIDDVKRIILNKYEVTPTMLDKTIDEYVFTLKKLNIVK